MFNFLPLKFMIKKMNIKKLLFKEYPKMFLRDMASLLRFFLALWILELLGMVHITLICTR